MAANTRTYGNANLGQPELRPESQEFKQQAGQTFGELKETAEEKAKTLTEKAKSAASAVGDKASEMASSVAEGASRAASAVGDKVDEGMSAVGGSMRTMGNYLEEHGVRDLGQEVTNLVRKHPIPSLLVAIGLGFFLARSTRS